MKEAIITDLQGYMTDVTLVADAVSGVFPIYERPAEEVVETDRTEDARPEPAETQAEPGPVLIGYTVAVPVPLGLYKPRFDIEAWKVAEQTAEERESSPIDLTSLWNEGLTAEEIDELRNRPQPTSPTDLLGQELAQMKLQNMQQQAVIDSLGKELTKAKLEMIEIKGGRTA
ncbi:XkdW family protein [Paenibacillus sp. MSJ-34]|uniref:XkdW family protein n=1 Tax=Paenibacillus sp. MSJ-34 TaxID=2841529 RepID=UPI001C1223A4|nr:XkdW family protein [Paenibacillus sp. MSJ-34]MBU5445194.1 XkdW family protein [Paenibacillus sp. MSJ-34]